MLLGLAPAHAAVLIPIVPVKNASTTTAFGMNDNNIIVGSYIGSGDGIEHGFFGTLAGVYRTFDAGTDGTEPRGMNDKGIITGYSNSQNGTTATQPIFERLPGGKILNVTASGQPVYGFGQGINSRGTFAGGYWSFQDFAIQGFTGRNGEWKSHVNIPAPQQAAAARGIDDLGDVVGFYFTPPTHGFILNHRVLTVVDYPGAPGSVVEGINDKGQAVGQWTDNNNKVHSFLYDIASTTFTDIKVKGAKSAVQAWSINAAGAVAVSSDAGSFIWCETRKGCPTGGVAIDAPAHMSAKALPQFVCGRVCVTPAAKAGTRALPPRIPGAIAQ